MADCPYSKIAVMQLFYELKQKFPSIPDQVVTDFIQQASYNKEECEKRLRKEHESFQLHAYPVNIVDKMTEGKGRPKTLSLSNVETNSANLFKREMKNVCVEEQRKTGCILQDAMGEPYVEKANCENLVDDKTEDQCSVLSDLCQPVQNIDISNNQSDVFVSDLKLLFQNDKCGCERTSLRVEYKKGTSGASHSAPTTPSSFQKLINGDESSGVVRKHRSSLDVDCSIKSPSPTGTRRPSTTVMLTIRPPSTEPQPPVNIATKGSNLLYSTSSYNPKIGYQNQLQISISEEGSTTLTAFRTRANSSIPVIKMDDCDRRVSDIFPSVLPVFDNALSSTSELRLREQKERKRKLEEEYKRDKQKLMQIQQEVLAMRKDLERRKKAPLISHKVLQLRAEVVFLQEECAKMFRELELAEGQVTQALSEDNSNWTCHACTFKNHPMLPKCEQCDMARVNLSNSLPNLLRPPTTSTQLPAIHPRV